MSPAQQKALIGNVLELLGRMRHVEGALEGLLASERERINLLKHLRTTMDHVLRLIRQKEALLEAVGRMALDLRDAETRMEIVAPDMANIQRIAEEIARGQN